MKKIDNILSKNQIFANKPRKKKREKRSIRSEMINNFVLEANGIGADLTFVASE
jgi:hypothetical protein